MNTRDLTRCLKDILGELQGIQEELKTRGGLLPLKDEVELGQALWRISNISRTAMEPLKASLRKEAQDRSGGRPGTQILHGRTRGSRCIVQMPHPQVRLRENISFRDLENILGDRMSTFFTIQVQARPDFHEHADESKPQTLAELAEVIDTVSVTPRVSFLD